MTTTPLRKFFCPRCRAAYDADHRYCGRCGADMHHASRLNADGVDGGGRTGGTQPPPYGRPAETDGGRLIDPWLGRVVDGRYRVSEVLGRGGMGVVYRVEHQRMSKIAAMKVLHRDLASDRDVIERFHREAEAVSRLTHPNTVQVFDFGVVGGQPFLVMEYVRGLDLGSLLDRDGPMPFERAAPLFAQICAALAEAHDLGVVHRDLKPENILVTRTHAGDDFVKVLDFGLAKLAEREDVSSETSRGNIVGTPYYMAPEQIRGEAVDARTDLYSLGALMYRVLTAEPPFQASTPVGVLTKHLTETLQPPARRAPRLGLRPEVDAIVVRAMAKRPSDRFPSATAMLGELEEAWAAHLETTGGSRRLVFGAGASSSGRRRPEATEGAFASEASDQVLRRSDLDAFEASLKRRRRIGAIALPLVLALAGVGAWLAVRWRETRPHDAEVEPNDVAGDATRIAAGTTVRGYLGRRRSPHEGDRDVFRLEAPARPGRATIRLGPLPNMDVELEVHDRGGQLLGRSDEGRVGAGEVVRDVRVEGAIDVVVAEVARDGAMPTENVSDAYELVVELTSP